MSEVNEQPIPQEARRESRVVSAARAGVRTALETSEAIQDVRAGMEIKQHVKGITERPNVYRAWMDATDKVVGAMTRVDQKKLSTKLYKLKMGMMASGLEVSTWTLDSATRMLSWPVRVLTKVAGLVLLPFTGGASLEVYVFGKAMDVAAKRGTFSTWERARARKDAQKKLQRYHIAEAGQWVKKGVKNTQEITKNILVGFAYPEGKPVPPPKTFGEKIKRVFKPA